MMSLITKQQPEHFPQNFYSITNPLTREECRFGEHIQLRFSTKIAEEFVEYVDIKIAVTIQGSLQLKVSVLIIILRNQVK